MRTVQVVVLLAAAALAVAQSPKEANYPFVRGFQPSTISMTPVNYTAPSLDGPTNQTFQGYAVYDNRTTDPRPGVLIIPDIDGIGPYEMWRSKLLATMGYTAFIADWAGINVVQGPNANSTQDNQITGQFRTNPGILIARLTAALNQLRDQPTVEPTLLAAIGYCFGGGAVINLARYGPNGTDGLRGVMSFHGTPLTNPQKNFTAGNPIRVSIQTGYDDPLAAPADRTAVEAELEAANVTWDLTAYSQTVHAFTNPSNVPPTSTIGYNQVADVTSWWALRGFLLDVFQLKNVTNPYTVPDAYDEMLVASA